jgi:hypothetical protein
MFDDDGHFILFYAEDIFARAALECYAEKCEFFNPQLAADIRQKLADTKKKVVI